MSASALAEVIDVPHPCTLGETDVRYVTFIGTAASQAGYLGPVCRHFINFILSVLIYKSCGV